MALKPQLISVLTTLVQIILLFSSFTNCSMEEDDNIRCLKSIKESLQDPFHRLSSWNFSINVSISLCRFVGVSCWNDRDNRILNLQLNNMGLRGQFPASGIGYCTSLQKLDLSGNHLWGSIPSDVCQRLKYVTSIDLSYNNFSGQIPSTLADCYYLNTLVLDGNHFSGQVPEGIGRLPRIHYFSVANNSDKGLCGLPLEPNCKIVFEEELGSSFNSYSSMFIIGFGVGFVIFGFLVSFCCFMVDRYSLIMFINNLKMKMMIFIFSRRKKNTNPINYKISTLERVLHAMNYTELCEASDNFSKDNIIGYGKTGTMYQGNLQSGSLIAIKTIHKKFKRQFINEAMILGRFKHNNIIQLLRFCKQGKENNILIYKFMSKGNLYDWLHCEDRSKTMGWPLRVKVAIGLARGLVWLHHYHINLHVVHLNICSKCILLDKNFDPKISNFGGALLFNYMGDGDARKKVTHLDYLVKKDVYCFGIVVLELITGLVSLALKGRNGTNLKEQILSKDCSECFNVDKSLIELGFEDDILHFLSVVRSCVQALPERRPTMIQVYRRIMGIGHKYGLPYDSEISRLLVLQMKSFHV